MQNPYMSATDSGPPKFERSIKTGPLSVDILTMKDRFSGVFCAFDNGENRGDEGRFAHCNRIGLR